MTPTSERDIYTAIEMVFETLTIALLLCLVRSLL